MICILLKWDTSQLSHECFSFITFTATVEVIHQFSYNEILLDIMNRSRFITIDKHKNTAQIRDNSSHWEIKNDFYASKPWKCISSMTSFLANLHTTFLNKLNAIKSKSCWYKFTLSNEWKYFPLRHFILCVVHVVIIWNVAIKLLINYANHTSERYVNEDKSKDDDLIQLGTTSYTQFMSNWEIKTCITLSTTQKHQLVTNVWHEMTWRDWIKIEEKWRKREKNCIELHLCRWITIIIIESENHFGISKKNYYTIFQISQHQQTRQ